MITQDEAIQMAREVGASDQWVTIEMTRKELTEFANAVWKHTLLVAAEFHEQQYGVCYELRHMANDTLHTSHGACRITAPPREE